jgi:ribosomal protein S18 acetylase RimI-like enzyme
MSIHIREATPADLDAIHDVLREAFAPYRASYTDAAFHDTVPPVHRLRERLREMVVVVAELDARVVGTLAFGSSHGRGYLRGMAVAGAAQGRGVGSALLRHALERLRAIGHATAYLETVAVLERAIALYQAHGFVSTGRRRDFYGMPLEEYERSLTLRAGAHGD